MKERPILFSAPMVRAILAGRKTQTRRVVKPRGGGQLGVRPDATARELRAGEWCFGFDGPRGWSALANAFACPYGKPGDTLWVRETWGVNHIERGWLSTTKLVKTDLEHVAYFADGDWQEQFGPCEGDEPPWRPSIHMPRWASRITLEVTDVRVERLQDISEEDARAEGADRDFTPVLDEDREDPREVGYPSASDLAHHEATRHRRYFRSLWESINGAESWDANPWVWVVEFRRTP